MYKAQLVQQTTQTNIVISVKCGRPTLLPFELDEKLTTMIKSMRILDRPINIHIVRGFVTGFFCSDAEKYGYYLDLQVTTAWARSLYNRIKWSRSGFNRPIITYALRKEISTYYLHDISFFAQSFTKFLISSYRILAKAFLNL